MEKTKNEVATTMGGTWAAPAVEEEFSSAFGEVSVGEAEHRITPKILVMQPTSKLVAEGKVGIGTLINSATGAVIAGTGEGTEFIVLSSFITWVVFEIPENGKPVFVDQFPYTIENSELEREFEAEGKKFKNMITYNYVVCLTEEIEAGCAFPYVLSLRSTGVNAAKSINTIKDQLAMRKKPLPIQFTTIKLNTSLQTNDQGTWHKPEASMGRPATGEELTTIKRWFDILRKSELKVDNSEFEEETSGPINVTPEETKESERQF